MGWGAALGSIFVPIAHFVLVPSFFLTGLYLFVTRLRTEMVVSEARGSCPDCGAEQDFGMPGLRSIPHQVECEVCRRVLTVSDPDEPAA